MCCINCTAVRPRIVPQVANIRCHFRQFCHNTHPIYSAALSHNQPDIQTTFQAVPPQLMRLTKNTRRESFAHRSPSALSLQSSHGCSKRWIHFHGTVETVRSGRSDSFTAGICGCHTKGCIHALVSLYMVCSASSCVGVGRC
jgi:hypothetical protein